MGKAESKHWLCDKYDACTALTVRTNISSIVFHRVVFSAITFAMGLDSRNIRKVIHWKPPNGIEGYVQESVYSCCVKKGMSQMHKCQLGEMKHYIHVGNALHEESY